MKTKWIIIMLHLPRKGQRFGKSGTEHGNVGIPSYIKKRNNTKNQ